MFSKPLQHKHLIKRLLSWGVQLQGISTVPNHHSVKSLIADDLVFDDYEKHRAQMQNLSVPEYYNFASDVVDFWAYSKDSPKSKSSPAFWWIDDAGNEIKWNFDQVSCLSRRLANVLTKSCDLSQGDTFIVILPRIPEWWIINVAAIRAGIILSSGTTQLRPKDIELRLKSSQAKCIITDSSSVHNCTQVLSNCPSVKNKIFVGEKSDTMPGWHNYDEMMSNASDEFQTVLTKSSDPMTLYFTSGTTGAPKMAEHTFGSNGFGHIITARYMMTLHHSDIVWNLSDTGWAKASWSSLFSPWLRGACAFVHHTDRFDPLSTLKILQKYRPSHFCSPPTVMRFLVKEQLSDYPYLKDLKCFCGGEPVNPELHEEWEKGTGGGIIYEIYGQTETTFLCGNYPCVKIKPGSMGKAAPSVDLQIVDDEGNILPNNKEGNIAIRVKPYRPVGLFYRYSDDENRMKAVFKGDFYLTGDRGYKDDEDYFWFVGRADDIIISAGYRIGPFDVESALIEHPSVLESAVVSSPDPVRGEVVKAFIILTKQYKNEDKEKLSKELQDFVKSTTAPYKYPRKIEFVEELPKTVSGKIRRVELRENEWKQG